MQPCSIESLICTYHRVLPWSTCPPILPVSRSPVGVVSPFLSYLPYLHWSKQLKQKKISQNTDTV